VVFVDTHCHLNFNLFDEDRSAIIENARQAGVIRILNPGIDLVTSQDAITLAQLHPEVYAAIGIHPNDGDSWDDTVPSTLRSMASGSKVVAIGEIGLDYYRKRTAPNVQKRIFRLQLELAGELGLPVIIHNRQASDDILEILEKWYLELDRYSPVLAKRPGVLHSFSDNLAVAQRAMALNFDIGITGPITFKNAPELQKLVSEIPLSFLLIETDAPFLTPHPFRGRRNEPANVYYVAEKIAEIKNLPITSVAEQTTANASRLFDW